MAGHLPKKHANYRTYEQSISSSYPAATTGNLDDTGKVPVTLQGLVKASAFSLLSKYEYSAILMEYLQ
jgi:hypothetical protein